MSGFNPPFFSVIIPSYNRIKWVARAIESVLAQSWGDFELIVVDDGSTDGTPRKLRTLYGERIRLICQENSGVSAARNTGLTAAKAEWVAFLDSDDEWHPNYLEAQAAALRLGPGDLVMQATNCTMVGHQSEQTSYFELNGVATALGTKQRVDIERPLGFIVEHAPWQLGSIVMRRSALHQAGGFDESLRISEDLDAIARVSIYGSLGCVNAELAVIHRREENEECLTAKASREPISSRVAEEKILQRLCLCATGGNELGILRAKLAANRRAIGNLHSKVGNYRAARQSYGLAFAFDKSAKSAGRYLLSLLALRNADRRAERP